MTRKTARQIARSIAKHVKLDDGDILLLKRNPDNVGEDLEVFNALRNAFGLTERKRCIIMIVDSFDDVMTLDENDMLEYGWCRCTALWDEEEE